MKDKRRNLMSDHILGNFEHRNANAEFFLREISTSVAKACPPGFVFALLLASIGEGGSLFYASNGHREDLIATMKEFILKVEAK